MSAVSYTGHDHLRPTGYPEPRFVLFVLWMTEGLVEEVKAMWLNCHCWSELLRMKLRLLVTMADKSFFLRVLKASGRKRCVVRIRAAPGRGRLSWEKFASLVVI